MQHANSDRALRTREALLAAGFDLMIDRSVDAIPIDDLVAAAGVGKGSFFNHFGDKTGFKAALAIQVRGDVESQITTANLGVTDPLKRLAGGMREVTRFALNNRKRTIAMLRMTAGATARDYPLNEGVRSDIEACLSDGVIRSETAQSAMLIWLGLCVALITHVVESDLSRQMAADMLRGFVLSGLIGLGANETQAREIAIACAKQLAQEP